MNGRWARNVMAGALAWLAFCLAVVAARGVRWDETYEFAQVILGLVKHPDGHPLVPYVRNAYSLQVYATAALLWLTGSALAVNAIRNFLFIAATVLPAYLLGAKLSGRAVYGHAAALLLLAGVHLELRSTYPQFVWPDIFSNGHVGTAWALLAVCAMAAQWWRAGFLLLGLMPCIHVGQAPPMLALGGAAVLWLALTGRRRDLKQGLVFFGAGVAACAFFWLAQRPFVMPAAAHGAYAASGDIDAIWKNFVAYHDIHRSWPPVNGQVGLGLLLLVSGLMTVAELRRAKQATCVNPAWPAVFAYAAAIGALVWGTMAVHALMGPATPRIALQWMPYRLLNHAQPLLIAAACGILARDRRAAAIPLAVLAAAAVLPYTHSVWPEAVYARYLAPHAGLVFLLAGAALFRAAAQALASQKAAWAAVACAAAATAAFHQYGAAMLGAGAVLTATLGVHKNARGVQTPTCHCEKPAIAGDEAIPPVCSLARVNRTTLGGRPFGASAATALILATAALFLHQQRMQRQMLPVGGFERSVESYLAARGEHNAMLAGPPKQLLLQAKTKHPVITDMALPYMITYLPSIGPSVSKLYADVYGIDLTARDQADWRAVWVNRPRERWRELAQRYAFRYVVAPSSLDLDLRMAISAAGYRLYAIED